MWMSLKKSLSRVKVGSRAQAFNDICIEMKKIVNTEADDSFAARPRSFTM